MKQILTLGCAFYISQWAILSIKRVLFRYADKSFELCSGN